MRHCHETRCRNLLIGLLCVGLYSTEITLITRLDYEARKWAILAIIVNPVVFCLTLRLLKSPWENHPTARLSALGTLISAHLLAHLALLLGVTRAIDDGEVSAIVSFSIGAVIGGGVVIAKVGRSVVNFFRNSDFLYLETRVYHEGIWTEVEPGDPTVCRLCGHDHHCDRLKKYLWHGECRIVVHQRCVLTTMQPHCPSCGVDPPRNYQIIRVFSREKLARIGLNVVCAGSIFFLATITPMVLIQYALCICTALGSLSEPVYYADHRRHYLFPNNEESCVRVDGAYCIACPLGRRYRTAVRVKEIIFGYQSVKIKQPRFFSPMVSI